MVRGNHLQVGLGFGLLVGFCLVGCVSLEEHDRVKWSNRQLESRLAEREQELNDARNVAETLRARVDSCEGTQADKDRLVNSLQGENERLQGDASQAKN